MSDIDNAGGNETVQKIRAKEGEPLYLHSDLTRATDAKQLIDTIAEELGKIDIVINNCGMPQKLITVEEMPEELWDTFHEVNVKSVFLRPREQTKHG